MNKRFGIRTLLVLTATVSIAVAASVSLSERTGKFAGGLQQPDPILQKQLMADAKLENSRSFVVDGWRQVTVENRTFVDHLLFRQHCTVTFTTSETNGRSSSMFNCTNTYAIGLFGNCLVDSNEHWAMSTRRKPWLNQLEPDAG